MKNRPEHALSELKIEAWRNGIRLFRDACTLYRAESFSSSFALAVLAFEELGKVYGIDRICACACFNPESADEWISEFLSRGLLKNHRWKQQLAYVDSLLGSQSSTGPSIGIESLDYAKQQAIYVELENGCVLTPSRITQAKTLALLRTVLATIEAGNDVAFFGFYGETTAKSEWMAKEQIQSAQNAMAYAESGG